MPLAIPANLTVPVTFDALWVSCQVMVPIPPWPIIPPAPSAAVVESLAEPDQVPVSDEPGAVGELELPQAARNKLSTEIVTSRLRMSDLPSRFLGYVRLEK